MKYAISFIIIVFIFFSAVSEGISYNSYMFRRQRVTGDNHQINIPSAESLRLVHGIKTAGLAKVIPVIGGDPGSDILNVDMV